MSDIYIDTHCHLDLIKDIQKNPLVEDSPKIKSISVTNAPSFYEHNRMLFKDAQNIRIAVGLHPELINNFSDQIAIFEKALGTTRYVGEIGLDGSPQYKPLFDLQVEVFEKLLSLIAKADNKILTVHSRNAPGKVVELLTKHLRHTKCKVILHWYSGDLKSLKDAVAIGCYFSINHKMVTTAKGQQIIKALPIDKILTETDAPFSFDARMTTRLQSLQASITGISDILQIPESEVQRIIYSNFSKILS